MKRLFLSCLCLSLGTAVSCSGNDSTGGTDGPATMNDMATPTTDDMATPADMTQQTPAPTEFLVLRVGTGTAMVSGTSTAAFIERHKIADGSLVGQAIALPTAASGNNHILTLTGAQSSEGALTRSQDGRYVLFAGYDAAPGTLTAVATALRVVGRMDSTGAIDTTTTVDMINGTNNYVRSAASIDGSGLWVGGVVGVAYTTFGKTGNPVSKPLGSTINSRVVNFFNGQLYVSRQSDTSGGVNTVGTGAPMADNATATQLNGMPKTGNVMSPYGFAAFDTDTTAGIDLLYIADDRTDGNGGVQRWRLSGTTWMLEGTLTVSTTLGCRGLAAFRNGTNTVIIASTTETTANRVVTFTDNGGATTGITATPIATAAANTAFRGVALPPG